MTTDRSERLETSIRFYRSLLVVYPRAHRERFGPAMVETFEDLYLDTLDQGSLPVARMWLHVAGDLLVSAARERLRFSESNLLGPWILASVLGWLVAWVAYVATRPEGEAPTLLALGGALVSVMHYVVLRSVGAPVLPWRRGIPIRLLGWGGAALLFAKQPWAALPGPQWEARFVALCLMMCALAGVGHFLSWTRGSKRTPVLAVLPGAGLIVGGILAICLSVATIQWIQALGLGLPVVWTIAHGCVWTIFGVVYGAITGAPIQRKLLEPEPARGFDS